VPRRRGARHPDGRVPLTPEPGPPPAASSSVAAAFVDQSRRYLVEDFLPRILTALDRLSDADLWWRPNEASNSAGNLVLHVCGNARQWIVGGVGGAPDTRERQVEFDARGGVTRAELVALLERTFADLDRTLRGLDAARLLERRVVQGQDVTVLEIILHVVEHVSHHTGQLLWIAKARSGVDLGLWQVRDGVARPTWKK
jgi:uncharacterized damage-inducible protein DinB